MYCHTVSLPLVRMAVQFLVAIHTCITSEEGCTLYICIYMYVYLNNTNVYLLHSQQGMVSDIYMYMYILQITGSHAMPSISPYCTCEAVILFPT